MGTDAVRCFFIRTFVSFRNSGVCTCAARTVWGFPFPSSFFWHSSLICCYYDLYNFYHHCYCCPLLWVCPGYHIACGTLRVLDGRILHSRRGRRRGERWASLCLWDLDLWLHVCVRAWILTWGPRQRHFLFLGFF